MYNYRNSLVTCYSFHLGMALPLTPPGLFSIKWFRSDLGRFIQRLAQKLSGGTQNISEDFKVACLI